MTFNFILLILKITKLLAAEDIDKESFTLND